MRLSRSNKQNRNSLALAFAIPVVGMLFVMLISQYEPFGKYSMLYSDMYHRIIPSLWSSAAVFWQGRACCIPGAWAWAWTIWASSPIIWHRR